MLSIPKINLLTIGKWEEIDTQENRSTVFLIDRKGSKQENKWYREKIRRVFAGAEIAILSYTDMDSIKRELITNEADYIFLLMNSDVEAIPAGILASVDFILEINTGDSLPKEKKLTDSQKKQIFWNFLEGRDVSYRDVRRVLLEGPLYINYTKENRLTVALNDKRGYIASIECDNDIILNSNDYSLLDRGGSLISLTTNPLDIITSFKPVIIEMAKIKHKRN